MSPLSWLVELVASALTWWPIVLAGLLFLGLLFALYRMT